MADSMRWWFGFAAVVWLTAMTVVLVSYWYGKDARIPALVIGYAALTVLASLMAAVLFGVDKRRAIKDRPRISERMLHATSLVGGWPGAYLAQQMFRHKTQKNAFRLTFWLIVLAHLVLIGYALSLWWNAAPPASS